MDDFMKPVPPINMPPKQKEVARKHPYLHTHGRIGVARRVHALASISAIEGGEWAGHSICTPVWAGRVFPTEDQVTCQNCIRELRKK